MIGLTNSGSGWKLITENANPDFRVGKLVISSLLCKVVMENHTLKAFQVVVAITAHASQTATHSLVDTGLNDLDHGSDSRGSLRLGDAAPRL
jgi:hypothetical protein